MDKLTLAVIAENTMMFRVMKDLVDEERIPIYGSVRRPNATVMHNPIVKEMMILDTCSVTKEWYITNPVHEDDWDAFDRGYTEMEAGDSWDGQGYDEKTGWPTHIIARKLVDADKKFLVSGISPRGWQILEGGADPVGPAVGGEVWCPCSECQAEGNPWRQLDESTIWTTDVLIETIQEITNNEF